MSWAHQTLRGTRVKVGDDVFDLDLRGRVTPDPNEGAAAIMALVPGFVRTVAAPVVDEQPAPAPEPIPEPLPVAPVAPVVAVTKKPAGRRHKS